MTTEASQVDWVAHVHARVDDPGTSHTGAQSVKRRAQYIAARVLRSLKVHGPANFSALADRLHLEPSQVWRRLSDLKNQGLIEPTNETAPGLSGRPQTIWRAKS